MTENGHRPTIVEYRCHHCGRRLFDAYLAPGTKLRIRCTRSSCGKMNLFGFEPVEPEPAPVVQLVAEAQL